MTLHLVRGVKHVANTPRKLVFAMLGVFFGCSALYGLIEHKGPIESMWWAIVTSSTTGYGDQYPVTTAGRGVGALLMVLWFFLALCAAAQLTANLIADPDCFSDAEQEQIKGRLDEAHAEIVQLREMVQTLIDREPVVMLDSITNTSNSMLQQYYPPKRLSWWRALIGRPWYDSGRR